MNENYTPSISVIVPIYNASAFIEACIAAILKQTYNCFELLLIDDCSNDASDQIAAEILSKVERKINYRIIRCLANGGVSEARNIGLSEAKGNWVLFLDADDRIEKNMLEVLFYNSNQDKVDIVFCNFYKVRSNIEERFESKFYGVQQAETVLKEVLLGNEAAYVWRCLIRKKLVLNNKIIFPSKLPLFEDALFLIDVLGKARKVYFTSDYLYNYLIHPTSAIHRFDKGLLVLPDYLLQLLRVSNHEEKWVYVNTCLYWGCVRASQYAPKCAIALEILRKSRSIVSLTGLYVFQKRKRLKGITFGLLLLKISPKFFYRYFKNYTDS